MHGSVEGSSSPGHAECLSAVLQAASGPEQGRADRFRQLACNFPCGTKLHVPHVASICLLLVCALQAAAQASASASATAAAASSGSMATALAAAQAAAGAANAAASASASAASGVKVAQFPTPPAPPAAASGPAGKPFSANRSYP